jgi:hypothetical protein
MLFAYKILKVKFIQMKKPKQPTLQDLETEKNKLYVSKQNNTRLKEILKKLDYFYWGIK